MKLLISLTKGITLPTEKSFHLKLLTDLQAIFLHKQKKYDRGALTERLNALFNFMANSGNELVIKNGLAHIILTTKMLEVKK